MKRLYGDHVFYEDKRKSAFEYIRQKLGIQRSVALMEDRLKQILEERK